MCGIAGFIGEGNEKNLSEMIEAIKYRGPDDMGHFLKDGVGLAHARLSILDLSSAGHQPMFNEDGSVAIVFNGEIYNFQDIKKELTQDHKFISHTDTETIIHLYEEIGEKCFEKLNGMFAIALYDFKKNKLILARDRMGKKPLYWGIFKNTLIFGSELKALMAHPLFEKEIDLESVNKFFSYEYIPTPHSIFKNVYKLEPATYLTYSGGEVAKNVFWQADFAPSGLSLEEAINELDKRLEESVKRRMISDVPLGVFLSGGLDSSAIAYYAQKNSKEKIKTFSIGFEEKSFDESAYAKQVSDFLGTEHYHHKFSSKEIVSLISKIPEIIDEPLADDSAIPNFLLAKFAREKVKVVLGGEGSDELLAGYPTFQAEKFARFYEKTPSFIRKFLIEKIVNALPVSSDYLSVDFKLKKFISGFDGKKEYRHFRWLSAFNKDERSALFKSDVWQKIKDKNEYEDIDRYLNEVKSADEGNKLLHLYMRLFMMDGGTLTKSDRVSMANSLEERAPFLDFNVVDFVNAVPYEFKIRGIITKYILKRAMDGKLPKEIIYRQKQGFASPLSAWLRSDLKQFCDETLSRKNIEETGLFDFEYIEQLKQEHFSGKKDNRQKLWSMITFILWFQKWVA